MSSYEIVKSGCSILSFYCYITIGLLFSAANLSQNMLINKTCILKLIYKCTKSLFSFTESCSENLKWYFFVKRSSFAAILWHHHNGCNESTTWYWSCHIETPTMSIQYRSSSKYNERKLIITRTFIFARTTCTFSWIFLLAFSL